MKNLYSLILLVSINFFCSQAQIANAGFENWAVNSSSGVLEPINWDVESGVSGQPGVIQDAGHTGNYCAKIISVFDGSSGSNYGSVIGMNYMPIHSIPSRISCFVKVNAAGITDQLLLSADVYDTLDNNISDVFQGTGPGTSITTWTSFSRSFPPSSVTPTYLQFSYGLPTAPNSSLSYGEIDDVTLDFPTGTNDFDNILTSFYMSDVDESKLHFSVTRITDLKFLICDLTGRMIKSIDTQNYRFGNYGIDISSGLSNGIYIVSAQSHFGSKSLRIIVQK